MRFVAPNNIMICRIPYMNPLVLGMSHKMASFWRKSRFDFIIMATDQNINDSLKKFKNNFFVKLNSNKEFFLIMHCMIHQHYLLTFSKSPLRSEL